MQGAIAAGNRVTAETGASVLADGGNAIDACIVAAFSAAVAEGPLTGPTGGGFLLAWFEGEATVLDCFFAAPSQPLGEMEEIVIDFGDASTQIFHVGAGSVAVPGVVAGLEEAHRRFGSRPWSELVQPAIELARAGLDTTDAQRFLHTILTGILERDEGGRRIYGTSGRIETGEFVATLERIRDAGSDAVGELLPELAGDIAAYEVAQPEPLRTSIDGHIVLTTPAPSRGGTIVAAALERLAGAESLADRAQALRHGYESAPPLTVAGTTHISVLDADGNAAAFSSTLGSGSGVFRGGTQLNNMLGELDVIGEGPQVPGARLPSMMTPTIVLDDGTPRLALGSAGSVRLAGAIAQVADAVLRGAPVEEAIERPRIHVEGNVLHLEGGLTERPPPGWKHVRWAGRNLFFGGVAAVERRADGTLAAAGDPRRGGHGIVVG
ncbi:MAG: gamma-glutamyltranspeptidase / glutathione hydrolase [Gaiellaceae bacterium]|jgi:gamma-glutamyltranspeptidase/glutathione hydrolase|nr:gamma-glutamyltranspeptidase / glutathione hydrolase [Gaiellaceae bacterium]